MGTDALLEILGGIPVTGETVTDLQAAKKFVLEYLYNQDVVTADVIINSEVRNHFSLKASFLKSLMQIYKQAAKSYQAGKAAKRAKAGDVMAACTGRQVSRISSPVSADASTALRSRQIRESRQAAYVYSLIESEE